MKIPDVVLVDTNAIIEAHDAGCWNSLSGALRIETVEACVIETQDGWRNRPVDRRIDATKLRGQLRSVHPVTELELAAVALAGGGGLDAGGTRAKSSKRSRNSEVTYESMRA